MIYECSVIEFDFMPSITPVVHVTQLWLKPLDLFVFPRISLNRICHQTNSNQPNKINILNNNYHKPIHVSPMYHLKQNCFSFSKKYSCHMKIEKLNLLYIFNKIIIIFLVVIMMIMIIIVCVRFANAFMEIHHDVRKLLYILLT